MIENAVKAKIYLVDAAIRKNVSLRDCCVSSMVQNVLRTRKGAGLGKTGRTTGYKGSGLVVAESRKDGILAREIVVHPHIELAFIQPPHRHVREVRQSGCVN